MTSPAGVRFRTATSADVPAIVQCRLTDPEVGPADWRMTAYLNGQHHPQQALQPRIGYLAVAGDTVIGYIAGHLSTRHGCRGELQYLFVAPEFRRRGIGTELVRLLAAWFEEHAAARVCVCVDADSPAAIPFYASSGASPIRKHWYVWDDIGRLLRDTPA